jgi:hypothetical protein
LFSVVSSRSVALFFAPAEISPLVATLMQRTPGYTPFATKQALIVPVPTRLLRVVSRSARCSRSAARCFGAPFPCSPGSITTCRRWHSHQKAVNPMKMRKLFCKNPLPTC